MTSILLSGIPIMGTQAQVYVGPWALFEEA